MVCAKSSSAKQNESNSVSSSEAGTGSLHRGWVLEWPGSSYQKALLCHWHNFVQFLFSPPSSQLDARLSPELAAMLPPMDDPWELVFERASYVFADVCSIFEPSFVSKQLCAKYFRFHIFLICRFNRESSTVDYGSKTPVPKFRASAQELFFRFVKAIVGSLPTSWLVALTQRKGSKRVWSNSQIFLFNIHFRVLLAIMGKTAGRNSLV